MLHVLTRVYTGVYVDLCHLTSHHHHPCQRTVHLLYRYGAFQY